ncbi:hypothetical protein L798_08999 [Zootermopsis nevadensis]|uniref:Uncharacterized protein n=1 Tax=Zootermopsis nevadensis TaxID=136037 RepID=A0A067RWB8_ZOONE|nr:hypothetical protein L798_08999 [Zootermopsis nevadensis]
MFYFKWLRRFIRRHTNPIPVNRAATVKKTLSVAYMLLAWNAFGFVCYMIYTGRGDWAKYYGYKSEAEASIPPAQQWARTLKIDKAKVIRLRGLHKEYDYDYENEDLKEGKEEVNNLEK